jgi:hypothetical protein
MVGRQCAMMDAFVTEVRFTAIWFTWLFGTFVLLDWTT